MNYGKNPGNNLANGASAPALEAEAPLLLLMIAVLPTYPFPQVAPRKIPYCQEFDRQRYNSIVHSN